MEFFLKIVYIIIGMKGFIVYATYRVVQDRAHVMLFGRLENGENFVTLNYFRPYFYVKEKDLKKSLKVESFEYEKLNLKFQDSSSM